MELWCAGIQGCAQGSTGCQWLRRQKANRDCICARLIGWHWLARQPLGIRAAPSFQWNTGGDKSQPRCLKTAFLALVTLQGIVQLRRAEIGERFEDLNYPSNQVATSFSLDRHVDVASTGCTNANTTGDQRVAGGLPLVPHATERPPRVQPFHQLWSEQS